MKNKKNRPESLSTSVRVFDNPDTGKSVHLVGAIHIGSPRYYRRLGQYLDSVVDRGGQVHYEGIGLSAAPEFTSIWDKVKFRTELATQTIRQRTKAKIRSVVPGIVEQADAMNDGMSSWERHDMEFDDYCRKIGGLAIFGGYLRTVTQKMTPELRTKRMIKKRLAKDIGSLAEKVETGDMMSKSARKDKVLIHDRNMIALDALQDEIASPDGPNEVAMLWGEAHLDGLAHGLSELGFVENETAPVRKIEALHIPSDILGTRVQSRSVRRAA